MKAEPFRAVGHRELTGTSLGESGLTALPSSLDSRSLFLLVYLLLDPIYPGLSPGFLPVPFQALLPGTPSPYREARG